MLYAAWAGVLGLRLMNWRAIVINTVRFVVLLFPVVLFVGTWGVAGESLTRLRENRFSPAAVLSNLLLFLPRWFSAILGVAYFLVSRSWGDIHTSYLDWWVRWTSERRWRWRPKS